MLSKERIERLRSLIIEQLTEYEKSNCCKHVKLNVSTEILEKILFDDSIGNEKKLKIPFHLLKKIDLTGVSWDGVSVVGMDFSNTKGVSIDPRKVAKKSLLGTKLNNVTLTGTFENVLIQDTDFTGSKGAIIDPQKLSPNSILGSKLCDTIIVGTFDNVYLSHVDFTGSNGAKINPLTLASKNIKSSKLCDVEFISYFDDEFDLSNTDFTGSRGAVIRISDEDSKNYKNTNFTDATIINIYEEVYTNIVKSFKVNQKVKK